MPSRPEDTSWDLSPVLDLINNLSYHNENEKQGEVPVKKSKELKNVVVEGKEEEPAGLGNFSKIWKFLGVPANLPPPDIAPPGKDGVEQIKDKDAYNSDGAIYCPPVNKGVKWRDEVKGGDLENIPQEDDDGDPSAPLTKKQRKQKKKEEKRLAKQQAESERLVKAASDFESESGSQRVRKAPAKKASVHYSIPPETPTPKSLKSRNIPSTPTPKEVGGLNDTAPSQFKTPKILAPKVEQKATYISTPKFSALLPSQLLIPPATSTRNVVPLSAPANPFQNNFPPVTLPQLQALQAQGVFFSPYMLNPHIPVVPQPALQQPLQSFQSPSKQHGQTLTVRRGEDRHWHFLLKLIHDFGEDKKWLVSPMQLSNNRTSPEGIHVFVDASNILIGFYDHLKRLQGVPLRQRTRRIDISFDSLVLLMERRRPVAKRVLVGSSPLLPAFETAKAVGYETNILDKVYKAKELTERQKFFQQSEKNPRHRQQHSSSGGEANGNSSGSETVTASAQASFAAEKWVEQGVDEILHLKILESVVDAERPSTIVLATGDAAEAEYSDGFMAMVERALKKGWKVELLSWSKNISFAYRKKEFQSKWAGKFKIIELDNYAEDLLDT